MDKISFFRVFGFSKKADFCWNCPVEFFAQPIHFIDVNTRIFA